MAGAWGALRERHGGGGERQRSPALPAFPGVLAVASGCCEPPAPPIALPQAIALPDTGSGGLPRLQDSDQGLRELVSAAAGPGEPRRSGMVMRQAVSRGLGASRPAQAPRPARGQCPQPMLRCRRLAAHTRPSRRCCRLRRQRFRSRAARPFNFWSPAVAAAQPRRPQAVRSLVLQPTAVDARPARHRPALSNARSPPIQLEPPPPPPPLHVQGSTAQAQPPCRATQRPMPVSVLAHWVVWIEL